jgi:hypothetical protein
MSKTFLIAVAAVLGVSAIFFAVLYFQTTEQPVVVDKSAQKSLDFLKLFIAKVLKAEGDVSFEDRLQLENSIRVFDDSRVLSLWKEFTEAENSDKAQRAAKSLLELLVNSIRL